MRHLCAERDSVMNMKQERDAQSPLSSTLCRFVVRKPKWGIIATVWYWFLWYDCVPVHIFNYVDSCHITINQVFLLGGCFHQYIKLLVMINKSHHSSGCFATESLFFFMIEKDNRKIYSSVWSWWHRWLVDMQAAVTWFQPALSTHGC